MLYGDFSQINAMRGIVQIYPVLPERVIEKRLRQPSEIRNGFYFYISKYSFGFRSDSRNFSYIERVKKFPDFFRGYYSQSIGFFKITRDFCDKHIGPDSYGCSDFLSFGYSLLYVHCNLFSFFVSQARSIPLRLVYADLLNFAVVSQGKIL